MPYKIPKLINLREIGAVGECSFGSNETPIECYDGPNE